MDASKFLSISEWCALHGKDPGNVRRLIQQGRLPAEKIGKQWVIPADAQPPADKRVKSGKYRNWRKKPEESGEPEA